MLLHQGAAKPEHKAERAKLKSPLSGLTADDFVLHVADIHDGLSMIDSKSITHIVCDPPYKRDELLPLLDALGEVAERVLTDDGVALVMVGGSWLPEAMQTLGWIVNSYLHKKDKDCCLNCVGE